MSTARSRMLELSPLSNTTARLHFLAITQGKLIITEGDYVADEITVECLVEELSDKEAELMLEQLAKSSAERVASVQETERIENGSI